jgi:hypothetical protein
MAPGTDITAALHGPVSYDQHSDICLLPLKRSCIELTLVSKQRNGTYCSDLVLSETTYMVGNACLFQLRKNGRDIVAEPVYSVSILSSISLCLLDIIPSGNVNVGEAGQPG